MRPAAQHAPNLPSILGNPLRLRQMITNLLGNAIKYTHQAGQIKISMQTDGPLVIVQVVDNGVGIPADKLETIFEPFVQLGRSLSSAHEGMGLGLAISRDLARAMNGDLSVRSTVGVGSTFTLNLPLAQ